MVEARQRPSSGCRRFPPFTPVLRRFDPMPPSLQADTPHLHRDCAGGTVQHGRNRAGALTVLTFPRRWRWTRKSLFTDFWTNESKTTRNVLARIPEGSDYRPDPKSRTAQEIAWQIVCEEKMIIDALESGKAEWAPPPMPATMKEVLEAYEKQSDGDGGAMGAVCPPRSGTARSSSSAAAARRRRWPGASCSTSCTTAGRSRPTCGRWDRRCRRSTDRAATNRSEADVGANRLHPHVRQKYREWAWNARLEN